MQVKADPTIAPKDFETTITLSENSDTAHIYTNEESIMLYLREQQNYSNQEKYFKTVGQKNIITAMEGTMKVQYLEGLINKITGDDTNE